MPQCFLDLSMCVRDFLNLGSSVARWGSYWLLPAPCFHLISLKERGPQQVTVGNGSDVFLTCRSIFSLMPWNSLWVIARCRLPSVSSSRRVPRLDTTRFLACSSCSFWSRQERANCTNRYHLPPATSDTWWEMTRLQTLVAHLSNY